MSWIEKCWYSNSRVYWLLMPLAWLYAAITAFRRWLFRVGLKRTHRLPVPVIVVGNISIGGTGKTPFTLMLCQLLQSQGWRPGIVSRGYGAKIAKPRLVAANDNAADVGDEPLLLALRSGCPVVVYANRVQAAEYLLQQADIDIIISDDGLQHYAMQRDIEIVLIDGLRGLGNEQLLPAGPLRERRWRLSSVDLVLSNSKALPYSDGVMHIVPDQARALNSAQTLSAGPVNLVAAIGNPARFAQTAQLAGFSIVQQHYFVDHHQFTPADFTTIATPILMTEKDAVKCRAFAKDDWFSLGVNAQLDMPAMAKLTTLLTQLRSTYGT
ncbi:tetraacyldisaccharide 4'-kinase [Rheinheimera sp. D18]|uniref:tetraacyldisaccharide 4'-kinase n=1 Tax=Rheinheimera sp. D18 TaxID=2545632 RepID=UPI00104E8AF7|nr:tetraacyldisaccharide 4'-kinase [Rheinheimera sp. D18]QBL09525.1 tetraacyldisaccharide 4'-kinase [Rheinheimera sp. D18]